MDNQFKYSNNVTAAAMDARERIKELEFLQALIGSREDVTLVADDLIDLTLKSVHLMREHEVLVFRVKQGGMCDHEAAFAAGRIGIELFAVRKRIEEADLVMHALLFIERVEA